MAKVDLRRFPDVHGHRSGGWAQPVQSSLEHEAPESRLPATYDQVHDAEPLRWRPLLEIDTDEDVGTSWSDLGCLYWLARDAADRCPGDDDVALRAPGLSHVSPTSVSGCGRPST